MNVLFLDDDHRLEALVEELRSDVKNDITWCTDLQEMEFLLWHEGSGSGIDDYDWFLIDAQLDEQSVLIPGKDGIPKPEDETFYGEGTHMAGLDWLVRNRHRLDEKNKEYALMSAYTRPVLEGACREGQSLDGITILSKAHPDFIQHIRKLLSGDYEFEAYRNSEFH